MNVFLRSRTEVSLRSLSTIDQKHVARAIDELRATAPSALGTHRNIYRTTAASGENLLVYKAGQRLRLILFVERDDCRIEDIVDHDRLTRLLNSKGQA